MSEANKTFMTGEHSEPHSLQRPRMVLRLGFAGTQTLSFNQQAQLERSLSWVLDCIGRQMAALMPGIPVAVDLKPRISNYYLPGSCPLLRLITGLCEGADLVAGEQLSSVAITSDCPLPGDASPVCLQTELAAILPFDVKSYRKSRKADWRARFDTQIQDCAYVLTVDGEYDKPQPTQDPSNSKEVQLAALRRQRAYRAQAELLLRHSDILLVATGTDAQSKAGGSLETLIKAQALGMPVVFLDVDSEQVRLLAADEIFSTRMALPPAPRAATEADLRQLTTSILATPNDLAATDAPPTGSLLEEFFDRPEVPQLDGPERKLVATWRAELWWTFSRQFGRQSFSDDRELPPYKVYRDRSKNLNYHYTGEYRGAFLANFNVGVMAVVLAAFSLAVLASTVDNSTHYMPDWATKLVLGLAVAKLALLAFIVWNTRAAKKYQWNERAVEYRYLAECLRLLYYLPKLGHFAPPRAAPAQYASRVIRQTPVEWLFNAIVRSVSPAEVAGVQRQRVDVGKGVNLNVRLIASKPYEELKIASKHWVRSQGRYHAETASLYGKMNEHLEHRVEWLGLSVVIVVIIDVVMGFWGIHNVFSNALIFVATVLPAWMASLNGISFQAESQRLHDRSKLMKQLLVGLDEKATDGRDGQLLELMHNMEELQNQPDRNPQGWTLDALLLTDRIAYDLMEETSEWTVIYSKGIKET